METCGFLHRIFISIFLGVCVISCCCMLQALAQSGLFECPHLKGILRNPDRTRTRTWTRTRRKPGLGKNPDSCSDSRLRNPDSKSKILDSMKLDSDNIRNKFSSLMLLGFLFQHVRILSYELSLSL